MLDKMSANQRLILAVVLSIVFFVGYTAIFPGPEVTEQEATASQNVEQGVVTSQNSSQVT